MTERECPLGLTYYELRSRLGDHLDEFTKWMTGQTVALCEEHGPVAYEQDYERFVRGLPVVD
ncbi:hypothetical protein [Jiangella anatolica]|uniref:Uncharacterized protein n=1 Tax=Jiangella anatolica TaxID=2670374 RepID=A0A2W2BD40_9ACTN|nr:hypothetical protein [Jiangella anatolica]PZF83230.1 hypothetical protein C1I92_13210 [Jiangella anatolica]